jgi:predicted DNA-binding protein
MKNNKTEQLKFRVTIEEREHIDALAKKANKTISNYLRHAIEAKELIDQLELDVISVVQLQKAADTTRPYTRHVVTKVTKTTTTSYQYE